MSSESRPSQPSVDSPASSSEEWASPSDPPNPSVAVNSELSSSVASLPTEASAPHQQDSNQPAGFLPVLKNRNFLILWIGQVFSQLADKIYLVLMIAIISSRFQGTGQSISGWVSALMITFTIPAVLFGFVAGVFVDRWSKKGVLVGSNVLRGALVMALPLLFWLTADWGAIATLPVGFFVLLGVTFLVSTLTQFFAPAEQSAIPLIVPRHHLLAANSLYTTTMMASVIVGFALGEPVLALADRLMLALGAGLNSAALETGKELMVGAGYAIAGVILIGMQTRETPTATPLNTQQQPHASEHDSSTHPRARERSPEPSRAKLLADMQDGLRFLKHHASVRSAIIQLIILFSIVAALAVLAVRLAEVIPALEADQFGFLLASGGVGMALGAAALGQFGQRIHHSRLTLIGGIGLSLSLMLLAANTRALVPALLCIGGVGLFTACIGIPMQTVIQAETPDAMRGKVFGLQNNAVNIALSLPLAVAGIAETFFGLSVVLLGLSALVIAGSLLTWYSAPKGSVKA